MVENVGFLWAQYQLGPHWAHTHVCGVFWWLGSGQIPKDWSLRFDLESIRLGPGSGVDPVRFGYKTPTDRVRPNWLVRMGPIFLVAPVFLPCFRSRECATLHIMTNKRGHAVANVSPIMQLIWYYDLPSWSKKPQCRLILLNCVSYAFYVGHSNSHIFRFGMWRAIYPYI